MHSTGILLLLFVCLAFVTGALVRHLLKRTAIPYSVVLLLLGLLIGSMSRYFLSGNLGHPIAMMMQMVVNIDPHLILYLFLPALVFESAFAMDTHLFKRMFTQICLLAIPGLIVSTLITAVFALWMFPWQWTWPIALMFGALVSATDPVAVVALLKEQSSRKRMETLIEGESLLNDGTAIVLFTLFYGLAIVASQATGAESFTLLPVIGQFVWVVSLGVAIGAIIGWICINWIGRLFNDEILEIVITLAAAYAAFIIAEGMFHVSGIVSVVTLALIFAEAGKTRFSPEVQHSLHHFWEVLSYLFNTLIFLIVGILIAELVEFDNSEYWLMLFILYIAVQVIRFISVLMLSPLLSRWGIGLTKEKSAVLIWGGLRGAVALALALAVAQTEALDINVRQQILFLTSGIVVLSILVNGGTMRLLMKKFKLDRLPEAKQSTVDKVVNLANKQVHTLAQNIKHDPYLQLANWQHLEAEVRVPVTHNQNNVNKEDTKQAFFRQLLEAEKQNYWRQFKNGLLLPDSLNSLNNSVQKALDGEPVLSERNSLKYDWYNDKQNFWFKVVGQKKDQAKFVRLVTIYNSCQGFCRTQEFLLTQIEQLAPSDDLALVAQNLINENIEFAQTLINKLEQDDKSQVKRIQTFISKKLLLMKERSAFTELIEQGVIEAADGEKLIKQVESRMQQLQRKGV